MLPFPTMLYDLQVFFHLANAFFSFVAAAADA